MAAALTVPGYAKPGHGNGSGHGNGGNHGQSGNHGGGNGNGGGNNGNHGGGNSGGDNGNHGGGNGNGNAGGNGNGHGHGKPTDGNTSSTFLIGSVSTSDTRILDLTGDYVLSSTLVGDTSSSLVLSIVQDARGRLVSSTTLTLADGTTTQITLTGHLQLTAQTNLRFQLEGGTDSDDDDSTDTIDDSTTSDIGVHIVGYWNGVSFNTTAVIEIDGQTYTFGGSIVPVNPLRGFTISDTTQTLSLHGPSRSARTVTLPWGTETITVMQKANKKFFMFQGHSANFGIDLRGTATLTGLDLSRAQIHLGYGSVRIDPDEVVATQTGATTP